MNQPANIILKIIPAYDHPQEVVALFSEYTNMLIAGDCSFQKYLDIQHYQKIIMDAKEIGYTHMLLDTLPFLKSALRIYTDLRFYPIESYNDSPMSTSIYMKLDL